jgi:hypothetical protein
MTAPVTAIATRRPTGAASGVGAPGRCEHCGRGLDSGPVVVEGTVRSVVYVYCGTGCRDEHSATVSTTPRGCYFCAADAVGDTDLCDVHVDVENAPATLPLAG